MGSRNNVDEGDARRSPGKHSPTVLNRELPEHNSPTKSESHTSPGLSKHESIRAITAESKGLESQHQPSSPVQSASPLRQSDAEGQNPQAGDVHIESDSKHDLGVDIEVASHATRDTEGEDLLSSSPREVSISKGEESLTEGPATGSVQGDGFDNDDLGSVVVRHTEEESINLDTREKEASIESILSARVELKDHSSTSTGEHTSHEEKASLVSTTSAGSEVSLAVVQKRRPGRPRKRPLEVKAGPGGLSIDASLSPASSSAFSPPPSTKRGPGRPPKKHRFETNSFSHHQMDVSETANDGETSSVATKTSHFSMSSGSSLNTADGYSVSSGATTATSGSQDSTKSKKKKIFLTNSLSDRELFRSAIGLRASPKAPDMSYFGAATEPAGSQVSSSQQASDKQQPQAKKKKTAVTPNGSNNKGSEAELFSVAAIVNRRLTKTMAGVEYKVRWAGYDESADSWEPMQNLLADDLSDLMNAYEERKAIELSTRRYTLPLPKPAKMKDSAPVKEMVDYVGKRVMRFFPASGLQLGRVKAADGPLWVLSFPQEKSIKVSEPEMVRMIYVAQDALHDVKRRKKALTYKGKRNGGRKN